MVWTKTLPSTAGLYNSLALRPRGPVHLDKRDVPGNVLGRLHDHEGFSVCADSKVFVIMERDRNKLSGISL